MSTDDSPLQDTVLFVDDEPSILSALRRLFRVQGYRVLVADSGPSGLSLLEQESVDVVVSDMRMPGMDGATFLAEVRQRWPDVGRILLTGYADIDATIAAINLGAIERHAAKPWNDQELCLAVRGSLERRALLKERQRLSELVQRQNADLQQLNADLEHRVESRTQELAQVNAMLTKSYEQVQRDYLLSIQVFAGLLELRDQAAAGHSREVADLARRVATRMDLNSATVQDIHTAAMLHEIGKIGFPDAMLHKPESLLSGDEVVRFRRYPLNGEAALLPLARLHRAAKLLRSHQERVDGRGYPDGLSGSDVPVATQIVGAAVCYRGLIQGKLSLKRHAVLEARTMMAGTAGSRFSHEVVEALLAELADGAQGAQPADLDIDLTELQAGMVLSQDLVTPQGMLLLARGFKFDARVITQLREIATRNNRGLRLRVLRQPAEAPATV